MNVFNGIDVAVHVLSWVYVYMWQQSQPIDFNMDYFNIVNIEVVHIEVNRLLNHCCQDSKLADPYKTLNKYEVQ